MSGLGDLFGEAEVRAVSAADGARLAGSSLEGVHGRVRRAHTRMAALRTGLAAVALVIVGAGVVYGMSLRGAPPVADSPSSSASASPSVSPSSSAVAWPGFTGSLTTDPHLPDAAVITPEVWASAGPGWALVSYREAWTKDGVDDRGPQVIYLVSPQGDRYELVNVPGDTVSVLAWAPGSTLVPAAVTLPSGEQNYMMLDLVTGGTYQAGGYAPYLWSLAFLDAEGAPVWSGNDATWGYVSIAPDGTQSEWTDPVTGNAAEVAVNKLAFPGIDCAVAAPYDDQSSIVECWDNRYTVGGTNVDAADAQQVIARVWPEEDRVEVLLATTYAAGSASSPTRVGDQVVAATGAVGLDGCANEFTVISRNALDAVPGWDASLHPDASHFLAFGAVGNVLTWGATSGCSAETSPIAVVGSDLERGRGTVLVPYPYNRPAGETPYQSVTGVAVAH